jgi:inorganic pyrophosphatase
MTDLTKLETWADEEHVYAVVETPRGSTCKLEFDTKLHVFTLAKPLMAGLSYPYDWASFHRQRPKTATRSTC